jgi:ATP-binding cassette, subfamily B, bacterial PglK
MKFFQITQKIYSIIYLLNRKKLILMILLALIIGMCDLLGVASIYPFMNIATSNELDLSSFPLSLISSNLGLNNRAELIFVLGVITSIIILFTMSLKIIATAYIIKSSMDYEFELSYKLFKSVINKSYNSHKKLSRNKNEKLILSEVTNFVHQAGYPLILLIVHTIIISMIVSLLFFINPNSALIIGLLFLVIYGGIIFFVKKKLTIIGAQRTQANETKFQIVAESFDIIKLIKLYKMENSITEIFKVASREFSEKHAQSQVIAQLPRFFVEMIALTVIILVISFIQFRDAQSFIANIPIITTFCLGAFKILPSAQQLYFSISQISYSGKVVDEIFSELNYLNKFDEQVTEVESLEPLRSGFENFELWSSGTNTKRLLTLERGQSIGLIGKSGSGKTTLLETLAGLVETDKFNVRYNGDELRLGLTSSVWQQKLAYVPQEPFLMSGTIKENICFGLPINDKKLSSVCDIAMLEGFLSDRENGIESEIGRFGSQLSGGEKQRIAIAQALYRDKEIFLMDEGTSALDEEFASSVITNLLSIQHLSLIIVSHSRAVNKMLGDVYEVRQGSITKVLDDEK